MRAPRRRGAGTTVTRVRHPGPCSCLLIRRDPRSVLILRLSKDLRPLHRLRTASRHRRAHHLDRHGGATARAVLRADVRLHRRRDRLSRHTRARSDSDRAGDQAKAVSARALRRLEAHPGRSSVGAAGAAVMAAQFQFSNLCGSVYSKGACRLRVGYERREVHRRVRGAACRQCGVHTRRQLVDQPRRQPSDRLQSGQQHQRHAALRARQRCAFCTTAG